MSLPSNPDPARPELPKPAYVPPVITTYTSDEIVEQVGPALTCSVSPCPSF